MAKDKESLFCNTCKCATTHRRLITMSFTMQCLVALCTKGSADLREPTVQCLKCGTKS